MTKVFIFFTFSFLFLSLFLCGHLTEQVVGEHWTRTSPAPPPQRTCAAVMPGQHHSWLLLVSSSGRPARVRGPRRGSVAARPPVDTDMAGAGSRPSSAYGPASSLPLPSTAAAAELHAAKVYTMHGRMSFSCL